MDFLDLNRAFPKDNYPPLEMIALHPLAPPSPPSPPFPCLLLLGVSLLFAPRMYQDHPIPALEDDFEYL